MAVTQRRMRWLLPVLVAFGVVCMHTLGHSADHAHQDGGRGAGAVTHVADALPHASFFKSDATSVLAEGTGPATPGSGMSMNPLSICVAILAAALILLFAALASVPGGRLIFLSNRVGAVLTIAGRGPPPGRLGLRLAHLSVQRT